MNSGTHTNCPHNVKSQVFLSSLQTAPVCKIISYIEMLTALASVINLTAVSIERWVQRIEFKL